MNPSVLEKQNVPRGYCGLCEKCRKPGHLRHFPGAVPASLAFCDLHYQRIRWIHPLGSRGIFVWSSLIIFFIFALAVWSRG
jgi:hypothetical protein